MKGIILFLSLILLSAPVFAAPDPAPPIKGKVLTADGQPAASVTVKVKSNGRTTLTDEDGFFTLSDLPAGDYDLEISLTGFATTTEHVTVQPHRTTRLAIHLQSVDEGLRNATGLRRSNGKDYRLHRQPYLRELACHRIPGLVP